MRFAASTASDIPQLIDWISADPFHHNMNPEWWLTGGECLLAFVVMDDAGPTMYVRLDEEGDLVRVHVQFGPEDEVSKKRVAASLKDGFVRVADFVKTSQKKGLVFESESPLLILFLEKMGFKSVGGTDYKFMFQEK